MDEEAEELLVGILHTIYIASAIVAGCYIVYLIT
jgi:hypothetical protein